MRELKLLLSCVITISRGFSASLTDKICALYPGEEQPIIQKVLQRTLDQDKSEFGTSFPPNTQWLNVLERISEGDRIANLGAGAPEFSILCAFKGAIVDMVDQRKDSNRMWENRLRLLEESLVSPLARKLRATYLTKVREKNQECLEFLKSAETSSYNHISCENLLHFFSDSQQSIMSSEVSRVLVSNGVFSVIVDRLPDMVAPPQIDNTFWVGRAVIDIGDGQATFTQPIFYEFFDQGLFTEKLLREYQISLEDPEDPETDKLFPMEKRQEYLTAAIEWCNENIIESIDLFGVSIEPRRLYTTTTIKSSEFGKELTLESTSQLSGFCIGRSLLLGYADDNSYFPRAKNMGAQKVSAIYRKE